MKKTFAFISSILLATTSYSQMSLPQWHLDAVTNNSGIAVGYIYHTAAIGTECCEHPKKTITELRLICSTKNKSNPIISVFWNGQDSAFDMQSVEVTVDKKPIPEVETYSWIQEGPLTYRSLIDSRILIASMKNGHSISFAWTSDNDIRKYTIFNLSSFNQYLNDFTTACRI